MESYVLETPLLKAWFAPKARKVQKQIYCLGGHPTLYVDISLRVINIIKNHSNIYSCEII